MSFFQKQPSTDVLRKRCSEYMYYLFLKSYFGMRVLLWISCIFSERLFPRTHLSGCFCCLLKIHLLLHENWKSYKCRQKKYLDFILASLQGCITVDSYTSAEIFYFFKCIINTNSWKLNVHPLVRWVIAMIHGYLSVINLKIAFSTRWDIFSAKRLNSSSSGIFRFLARLKMAAKAGKVELTEAFIMLGEEKNVTGI